MHFESGPPNTGTRFGSCVWVYICVVYLSPLSCSPPLARGQAGKGRRSASRLSSACYRKPICAKKSLENLNFKQAMKGVSLRSQPLVQQALVLRPLGFKSANTSKRLYNATSSAVSAVLPVLSSRTALGGGSQEPNTHVLLSAIAGSSVT